MKRRDAMALMLASCVAPMLAQRSVFARSVERGLINPPAAPMRFVRVLRRQLGASHSLQVERAFTVQFAPVSEGFSLRGVQSEVSVDLPGGLARFAELERARDDSGMFPIDLNGFGEIVSAHAPRPMSEQVEQAVSQTLAAIEAQEHADAERERLRAFAMAVHNSGGAITAHMPVDLFSPEAGVRAETQQLDLGNGLSGEVRTQFAGDRDSETGLMRAAWRQIITHVGDDARTTREEWSLAL